MKIIFFFEKIKFNLRWERQWFPGVRQQKQQRGLWLCWTETAVWRRPAGIICYSRSLEGRRCEYIYSKSLQIQTLLFLTSNAQSSIFQLMLIVGLIKLDQLVVFTFYVFWICWCPQYNCIYMKWLKSNELWSLDHK